jgi:hypothetical protein
VFTQLALGSLVIAATVAVQAEMYAILHRMFQPMLDWSRGRFKRWANTVTVMLSVLFILLTHTIQVWMWAVVLLLVGAEQGLEPALYFALVSFTTIGYGDIVMDEKWRLLSAMMGPNGLLMFGWSTAYMVDLVRRTA